MKYGFYVFNNFKGYIGLAIFENKYDAVDSYKKLDRLWNDNDYHKDFDDLDFEIEYDFALKNLLSYEEETGRDLENDNDIIENFKYYVNIDGYVTTRIDDIQLIDCISVRVPY